MLKKTRSIIVMSFCLMFGHSASAVLSVALDDAELAACVADQSIGID